REQLQALHRVLRLQATERQVGEEGADAERLVLFGDLPNDGIGAAGNQQPPLLNGLPAGLGRLREVSVLLGLVGEAALRIAARVDWRHLRSAAVSAKYVVEGQRVLLDLLACLLIRFGDVALAADTPVLGRRRPPAFL